MKTFARFIPIKELILLVIITTCYVGCSSNPLKNTKTIEGIVFNKAHMFVGETKKAYRLSVKLAPDDTIEEFETTEGVFNTLRNNTAYKLIVGTAFENDHLLIAIAP